MRSRDCSRTTRPGTSCSPSATPARGAEAVEQIGHADRCTVLEMDLASLTSVRAFVDDLPKRRAAATARDRLQCRRSGGVGHRADRRRCRDDVRREPPRPLRTRAGSARRRSHARPASSSSAAAPMIRPSTPACHRRTTHPPTISRSASDSDDGRRRYTTSKLCNVLFTYELDRRLGGGADGVTVNAFDPGLMPGSGLARDYSPMQRWAWRYVMPLLRVLPNVNSTRSSGPRLAALVTDPRFDGVTGAYFDGKRPIRSSADSYDRDKALDLWETSERLLTHVDEADVVSGTWRPNRRRAVAQDRRARVAVAALFLTNGAIFANLLPRYPEIKADLHLSNAVYGAAIAAFSAGALVAGLAAATLIRRYRSSRVAVVGTIGIASVRRRRGHRHHAADARRRTLRRGRVGRDHRRGAERARPASAAPLRPVDHQLVSRGVGGRRDPRRADGRGGDRAAHLAGNTFGDRGRRVQRPSS